MRVHVLEAQLASGRKRIDECTVDRFGELLDTPAATSA